MTMITRPKTIADANRSQCGVVAGVGDDRAAPREDEGEGGQPFGECSSRKVVTDHGATLEARVTEGVGSRGG